MPNKGAFMVIVIIALWIGSAVAGWYLYWPWLMVPVAVIGLHILRVTANMRAARQRLGMPAGGSGHPGTSMTGANIQLLVVTLAQHLAIFGVGAGIHWLIS